MDLKMMSAVELAFVGDAVYELEVRRRIAQSINTNPNTLHRMCVGYVNATAQHEAYKLIVGMLSEDEAAIARRGKNSTKVSVPKNASPMAYREATALEAVFGYLYLTGNSGRITELADIIFDAMPNADSDNG